MTAFTIDVTSDTVCPWCFVGARKLQAGIAAYEKAAHASNSSSGSDSFSVRWKPFLLNPDAPKHGVDKKDYYIMRFGLERTKAMQARLTAEGDKVGIKFDFGGRTGATRDSHRVIAMAANELPGEKGVQLQNAVVRELFESYFEQGGDITDHATIADAAARAGIDRQKAIGWLESNAGGDQVDAEVAKARNSLVTGVPNFVINGKYEIQGAQDPEGFKRVFEKIKEMDG